ncbi:uncharacterized protein LOC133883598 [Phragmites australis]|uniref:uncharacterized protein LOC133883598 n=1 Tax=Phragmites australis TaxID=29695 RepID=UPI002D797E0B|nr:uncharacterized protein LOC133883598 [Phragmites australis]
MASSSSSPPAPLWVILGRVALVQDNTIEDPGDLSVALAVPPRVSTLTVPMSVHPKPDDTDKHPYVLSADAGVLLLHVSHWPFVGFDLDRNPQGILLVARDFLPADTAAGRSEPTATAVRVPDRARPDHPGIANIKNVGLVSLPGSGGTEYVVAELRLASLPSGDGKDDRATLLSFRSGTDAWVERDLRCPFMSGRRWMWSSHDVVAHDGKLWWVNLVWGLLGCDPFADEPVLSHVVLPDAFPLVYTAELRQNIESSRMVRVSQGKVRFVDITRARIDPPEETLVIIWTLIFGPSGYTWWKQQCSTSLAIIWASDSYKATGMPEEVPVLALVHPSNPDVVYFFLEQYLFGVNVSQCMVMEFVHEPCDLVEVIAGHRPPPPISWRYILAWQLPPSLVNALDNQMDEDGASHVEGCDSSFVTAIPDRNAAIPNLNE